MENRLRVLIVEDSEDDTQLLLRELQRGGYNVEFERVETTKAMKSALTQRTWDLILSDYSMPNFSAPEALAVLKASGLDLPFIIISGTIGEENAVTALKAGANDFLVKGKFARLIPAIERELREAESRGNRKQAEEQVKYHARLLRHINDAVIATDEHLIITAWNRAAERIYGWNSNEVIGRAIDEVLGSGLSEEQRLAARALLKEKSSFRNEKIHSRKNGQQVYVEENTIALTDAQGKITGYVSVNRDITERQQTEAARLESEARYHRVLDAMMEGCQIIDFDWRYVYVNDVVVAQGKQTREELLNHTMMEIYPGIENTELFAVLRECMEQRVPRRLENQFVFSDGSIGWFELSVQPAREGIFVLSTNITERKRAEEALQESEEQYRNLFEDSPISLWLEDFSEIKQRLEHLKESGVEDIPAYIREHSDFVAECLNHIRVLDVNSAAVKLYQAKDKTELLGRLTDVLPAIPIKQFERELISLATGQFNFAREGVDETLTGEQIYVNIRCTVAPGYEEDLARVLVSTIDITERKRAEEQAQLQIQRLRSLHTIDVAIGSSYNLDLTLDILLNQVQSQLNVDAAAILFYQPFTKNLVYAAGRGFRSAAIRETRVRLGQGLTGKAILERRLIHVPDLRETDSEFVRASLLKEEYFIEYYGMPLLIKGEVKGVLEVFHRSTLENDLEWLDFLETLAGQAAIAIEDFTLFENLQRSNQELFQAYDATIEGWSHALDLRDKETEGHTQRVMELTHELARAFGFTEEQLINIRWGALLHDIGKMGVPDNILLKPDKLTDEEWEIMRRHPTFAFEMLSPIAYLKSSLDIPYCHHEKWDGSGYPRGLKGEVIPLAARLFAVVDVWDALRSDRPYRKAWTVEKTREHIRSLSGTHFDPSAVQYFLEMMEGSID